MQQRAQQPIPMYPTLEDERQQHQVQMPQTPSRDHEEIPLHNVGFNRSVSETPERVRMRQIFNRVSSVDLALFICDKPEYLLPRPAVFN